jgi:PncC family amidohydrolase
MNKELIENKVVALLIERHYSIACAESCTGGMLVSRIVNIPNASKVLSASFVTYSNEAKSKYLGVNPKDIEIYGAVSENIARQMAKGAALETDSEVGVGISGIAGPTGGTAQKPVGTVCFGFYVDGEIISYTKFYPGKTRNQVRHLSVKFALAQLAKLLCKVHTGSISHYMTI